MRIAVILTNMKFKEQDAFEAIALVVRFIKADVREIKIKRKNNLYDVEVELRSNRQKDFSLKHNLNFNSSKG